MKAAKLAEWYWTVALKCASAVKLKQDKGDLQMITGGFVQGISLLWAVMLCYLMYYGETTNPWAYPIMIAHVIFLLGGHVVMIVAPTINAIGKIGKRLAS